ncbi:hypothetical protein [Deinococcus fonticola]|uniref:hypothetical protein n=1 Tax=Deinococcus fonticola TaxID=2528713 RepID=UPI00107516A1|nr:hypothetical protein [Deinococcus fonticola]
MTRRNRKAKGNASTRLDALEQQAEQARAARIEAQERQQEAAVNMLGRDDRDFILDFMRRCEVDPALWPRVCEACAAVARPMEEHVPHITDWLDALEKVEEGGVYPLPPVDAAVWMRDAADRWHEGLEREEWESADLQDGAKWHRGYFRLSANLADVLTREARVRA